LTLAADYEHDGVHELEGDLQAFRLVDLDAEGLSEYRPQLQRQGINYIGAAAVAAQIAAEAAESNSSDAAAAADVASTPAPASRANTATVSESIRASTHTLTRSQVSLVGNPNAEAIIEDIFRQVDLDHNSRLSVEEAEKVLLRLNSRLGRRYGEDDVASFFRTLDTNKDGSIDLNEFRVAFERLQ
jgi:hypothetical protein